MFVFEDIAIEMVQGYFSFDAYGLGIADGVVEVKSDVVEQSMGEEEVGFVVMFGGKPVVPFAL